MESCSASSVGWEIQSTAGAYKARCVINCAGLFGDIVDMLGGNTNFRYFFTVNGYTFRGSNSTTSSYFSLLHGAQLLKERICSSGSKFFPLREDPFLEGFRRPEKQTGGHECCCPLEKITENMKVYPDS